MALPVTQSLFFETIKMLREENTQRHVSLRQTVEEGFRNLGDRYDTHTEADKALSERMLTIELERGFERRSGAERRADEQKRQDRRTALISTLFGGVLVAGRMLWDSLHGSGR